jgi:hypothetical protein
LRAEAKLAKVGLIWWGFSAEAPLGSLTRHVQTTVQTFYCNGGREYYARTSKLTHIQPPNTRTALIIKGCKRV